MPLLTPLHRPACPHFCVHTTFPADPPFATMLARASGHLDFVSRLDGLCVHPGQGKEVCRATMGGHRAHHTCAPTDAKRCLANTAQALMPALVFYPALAAPRSFLPAAGLMGKNGLSRKPKVRYGTSRVPGGQVVKTKSLSLNTIKAQRETEKLQHNEQIAGLSFVQHEMLDMVTPLPPGEEAGYMSHAGGESILHQVMEGVQPGYLVNLDVYDIDNITFDNNVIALMDTLERAEQLEIENCSLRDTIEDHQMLQQTMQLDFEECECAYQADLNMTAASLELLQSTVHCFKDDLCASRVPVSPHSPVPRSQCPMSQARPPAYTARLASPLSPPRVAHADADSLIPHMDQFLSKHVLMQLSPMIDLITCSVPVIKWSDELHHFPALMAELVEGLLVKMDQDRLVAPL
ncbi:hypothetical protein B0H14DRAFT_3531154 [Mycena olivaceomarginata]|nr:hypothetical protein B0H14DRAFT_3531154 [Mycena olivaceomarginata]